MAKTKQIKITKEQVFNGIGITLFLVGFTLASLSLIGEFLLPRANNWVRSAETAMNEFLSTQFSWLTWGSLFLVVGAIILVISLNVSANKETIEREKQLRRAQRLKDALES
jgi:type II secretory pathway component PulF